MTTGPCALYENRLQDAVPVASTTAAGFDVLNLRDMRDFTWWKPTALPATVTVDSGGAKNADYWAIYGHNLGSSGCTIELHTSTDNFVANDVTVDTFTPADDKPILRILTQKTSRYWRLKILNGVAPSIAIALIGNRLEFPVGGMQQEFDPIGNVLQGQTNRSVNGHPLGRIINYRLWSQECVFEIVSWTWVRTVWQAAVAAWLDQEPWLFAWNPDAYPAETYLVAIDADAGGWTAPHRSGSVLDLHVFLTGALPS